MNLLTGASLLARAKSIYYSQTLFYGHPLNTDTSLLWTISTDPSMSVLTGFDCSLYEWLNEMQPPQ